MGERFGRRTATSAFLTRAQVLRASLGLVALTVGGVATARAKRLDAWQFLDTDGFAYDAFDRLPATDIAVGGGTIRVAFAPGELDLHKDTIRARIRAAGEAVAHYYGRFPVPLVRYLIVPMPGEGVQGGTTWGYRGGACRILLGAQCDAEELRRDWITTHEMVHLALPGMTERYNWLSEGLAVYIEPVARVQVGEMPAKAIWSDMRRDVPKGLPRAGDEGLDNTPTWGRTYWGGALFCLLCDVGIRQRSENRIGLQEAMRGVLTAGGNHEDSWPIARILATADKATGFSVMSDLYAKMRAAPVRPDLEALWSALGVVSDGDDIALDEKAPLAAIRRAITRPLAS